MVTQAIDRIVRTTQGMQRGITKFMADLVELDKSLLSDFNDQEMATPAKVTKNKQLTSDKIASVFVLFFTECLKSIAVVLNKVKQQAPTEGKQQDQEQDKDRANERTRRTRRRWKWTTTC